MTGSPQRAPQCGPGELERLVSQQLDRAVDAQARAIADHLAARPGVVAVLFYGNRLRDPATPGLLDFYVLTERDRTWRGAGPGALANRLLPPNVYHVRLAWPAVAAKVAVMRLAAFRARMRRQSWDTTLWARFAQPAALLYARDAEARRAVVDAVATAWRTAAWWADRLSEGWMGTTAGPRCSTPPTAPSCGSNSAGRAASIARSAPESLCRDRPPAAARASLAGGRAKPRAAHGAAGRAPAGR